MSSTPAPADACDCCGRAVDASTSASGDSGPAGQRFCSEGCRSIATTLDPLDGDRPNADYPDGDRRDDDFRDGDPPASDSADADSDPAASQTFLRIDGMHSATCEAFLEGRATRIDGVHDATASYVTESVRVIHDESVDAAELRDALSVLGYDAYRRDDANDVDREPEDATVRSREMAGMRKRRSDQLLGFRYAAGVLFGAFLLLPYVVLVYPAHLARMIDVAALSVYEQTSTLEGTTGLNFLRTYFVLAGVVIAFTGMPVLRGAYASLRTRKPTTDLLVATTVLVAYSYGAVAMLAGADDAFFDLALVVVAVVTGAGLYETSVKQGALERLTDLTISQVAEARRVEDGATTAVPVEALEPGDRVLVRSGERVPIDGTLANEGCTVDESVVTGESVPVRKHAGDEVIGGSVVADGAALVAVDDSRTSAVEQITRSLWTLQSTDHGIQRRADRFAAIAAPIVALAALLAAGFVFAIGSPPDAALAAFTVLLAATPWALGLATPLSVASSIRAAVDRGIVVFDETIFQRLRAVDVVVFDKTGTLTAGSMTVLDADAPEELLSAVAAVERRASHPAARAIVDAFGDGDESGDEIGDGVADDDGGAASSEDSEAPVTAFSRHDSGVTGTVDGQRVAAGAPSLFAAEGWTLPDAIEERVAAVRDAGNLPVVVGRAGRAEGVIVIGDDPRSEWASTLDRLGERGVEVVVLTGDDESAATQFAAHDAVEHVFAGVPPAGKTEAIRRLAADHRVAMVGDGTNDAPALAAADLGIALGGGTALAADAADLAIASDDLATLDAAFELASAAGDRVRQNELLALTFNGVAIPAALVGLLNPVVAMLAAGLTAGLIGLNCSRSLLDD